ncbi:MAG: hypothetical protein ACK5QS_12930 [Pseudanabaenaceae cyanobacterium]|jgi:hypothetical protein
MLISNVNYVIGQIIAMTLYNAVNKSLIFGGNHRKSFATKGLQPKVT